MNRYTSSATIDRLGKRGRTARVVRDEGSAGSRFALLLLLLAASAAVVVAVEAARASHAPGGVYTGTHSNGGQFSVRGRERRPGRGVSGVPAQAESGCPDAIVIPGRGFIPITNHAFRVVLISSAGYTVTVTGSFPATGTAQGTLVGGIE